jgi:sensor histidine kinase YesM
MLVNNFYNDSYMVGVTGSIPGDSIKSNKLNRKKIYWLCQLTGWLLFGLVNVIVLAALEQLPFYRALLWFYICFTGVSFTHILRNIIKSKNWLVLPLKILIPRVVIASFGIGIIMSVLILLISLLTGVQTLEKLRTANIIVWSINLSSITFIWALIYFAVHYFENYKKAEIERYIWEAAVKDFELKTLKSQLNPHFMFNALNNIRALIREDPQNAQTAITKLSNILRYSLKIERSETVPLREEMQTVEDYLALESIRFEERLNYKIYIDPKAASIEIPPMMIQTLVENGIKHGISRRPESGEISVECKSTNSHITIRIENSGTINLDELKNSAGFGINNTKHRLNLLYGEDASFVIRNESKNKVVVELILPTGGIKNESFNS